MNKQNPVYYIYDGTFEGLLTCVYETYYNPKKPDHIIKKEEYQPDLFSQCITVKTNSDKAERVSGAIREKVSPSSFKKIYHAFLSETDNIELYILDYLKLGFKVGEEIKNYLTEDSVERVIKESRRVKRERHRLLGLLRFRELRGGVLYAHCEPDYNIFHLLAPHFVLRMANYRWVIHDKKRDKAIIYNTDNWLVIEGKNLPPINYSSDELFYQSLWENFFENIAVENRKNLKLQQSMMPKKYWNYLIEKN